MGYWACSSMCDMTQRANKYRIGAEHSLLSFQRSSREGNGPPTRPLNSRESCNISLPSQAVLAWLRTLIDIFSMLVASRDLCTQTLLVAKTLLT